MNKIAIIVGLLAVMYGGYIAMHWGEGDIDDVFVTETLSTSTEFTVYPVSHASFVFHLGDSVVYNDPIGEAALFQAHGPADIILVSDIHGDHLSTTTLESLLTPETIIIAPQAVIDLFTPILKERSFVMANGDSTLKAGLEVEAMPMYNLPENDDSRHAKGRGNGYLVTLGETKIYIAGDTADIPEMRSLASIDYAFIPMNLPYTMDIVTAADAVLAFAPQVVYPYHYRTPDGLSDVEEFKTLVQASNTAIAVELLDWYPSTP